MTHSVFVQDYEGTPYLWLDVAGNPIDNTYVDIPKTDGNLEYFYKAKQATSYVREDPFKTSLRLYLGQVHERICEISTTP